MQVKLSISKILEGHYFGTTYNALSKKRKVLKGIIRYHKPCSANTENKLEFKEITFSVLTPMLPVDPKIVIFSFITKL